VDVKRAADLYAQGRSLRQIGAELGVAAATVSQQLRRAGVTMRRGGPPAHPASTQQILDLRDQGLTWPEIAEQVGMTVSGAWSRHRRARPSKPPQLGRWQRSCRANIAPEGLRRPSGSRRQLNMCSTAGAQLASKRASLARAIHFLLDHVPLLSVHLDGVVVANLIWPVRWDYGPAVPIGDVDLAHVNAGGHIEHVSLLG
jgi:transposase-like protein